MSDKKNIGFSGIARAVVIGLAVFAALWCSPMVMLWHADVREPTPAVADEPLYRDPSGRVIDESDHFAHLGYERAGKEGIDKHADCRSWQNHWERSGCFRYVSEHFAPPHVQQGDWDSGKTTAQCEEEVRRFWDYTIEAERTMGNRGYGSRAYGIEITQCQNYDNIHIATIVQPYLDVLESLIARLEKGETIGDNDRRQIVSDIAKVLALPEHPYRKSYIDRSGYLSQLASGQIQPLGKETLNLSCAELQTGLEQLHRDDQADIAEMRTFERADRVVDDPKGRRTALNQRRIDRLWDFSRYEYNQRRLGCDTQAAKPSIPQ